MYDAIVKLDARAGAAIRWSAPNCFPAEPIFVPKPGGLDEDDGVLLTVVLDVAHERSFLAVLDARDLRERARATLPWPLPLAFHGEFGPRLAQLTDE
jgi:carotenoid cleavage dioxygenase-like enzyme